MKVGCLACWYWHLSIVMYFFFFVCHVFFLNMPHVFSCKMISENWKEVIIYDTNLQAIARFGLVLGIPLAFISCYEFFCKRCKGLFSCVLLQFYHWKDTKQKLELSKSVAEFRSITLCHIKLFVLVLMSLCLLTEYQILIVIFFGCSGCKKMELPTSDIRYPYQHKPDHKVQKEVDPR